jgi:hypothetical protein
MALPAIGYVTSGEYDGTFKTNFLAGLAPTWQGNPGPGQNVEIKPGAANGAYDAKGTKYQLNKHVARLCSDSDVKMIVAVGGLVSAFAAMKYSTKPFLVMIGQLPASDDFDLDPDDTFNFFGGINLATTAANAARHATVTALAACEPEQVFLVFNNNARMAKAERRAWKAHGWRSIAGGVDADGDNDAEDFLPVLRRAKNRKGAKAFVISADPFFALQRNALVNAINTVDLPACYPAKYFKDATPAPTPGRFKWLGPDLDEEYKNMGKKAGQLLTKIMASNPEFVGLDTAAVTTGP